MTEYSVLFVTKITAKNKKDLERKAELHADLMRQAVNKPVYPHSYGIIEKQDTLQSTLTDSDD